MIDIEQVVGPAITILTKHAAEVLAKRVFVESSGRSEVKAAGHSAAISQHLRAIGNWADQISFRELSRSRHLEQSFVDLDLEFGYRATRARERQGHRKKVSDLLDTRSNIIILGDPGAGKTTSLKRIAFGIMKDANKSDQLSVPLLVKLRELRGDSSLAGTVLELIGVAVEYDKSLDAPGRENFRLSVASQYLDKLQARVLVDGLDELHPRAKERVVRELRQLLLNSINFSVMLTCRTADFHYSFDNADVVVLESLSDEQIVDFARKWLGHSSAENFLRQVRATPYGGSEVLPLTLAHLCAIYERTGQVPEKPRTVYRKIVRLLLEEWDEQRSVKRVSKYGNFEVDRKEEFLRAIAFHLTLSSGRGTFDSSHLEDAFLEINDTFDLPRNSARQVVAEIESHTGLIVEVEMDHYEFAHKSIQEYLTAEYVLRLPSFPVSIWPSLPNEVALATAMSSDPNGYFAQVVDIVIESELEDISGFVTPFLRRLLLEKADFRTSVSLGVRMVVLYAENFFRSKGQLRLPFEVESLAFAEFLGVPVIKKSIQQALRLASVQENTDGSLVVLWPEVRTQEGHSAARIDRKFLDMVT